ncbi:unnamed protein product [Owenia fusiformis]|uniref:Uncharacterized protein n=1 Tax=Owenia fusiformis TaxID=6347 RepID=A0A8J1XJI3_OWEFU|nr:unnamed protein product [Owenia fusiformis]
MPQHKNHKGKGHKNNATAGDNNKQVQEHQAIAQENVDPDFAVCCIPTGCTEEMNKIDTHDPGDAVKVACNNDQCPNGNWMHAGCFATWEETVLAYLRSCGRARSWSEKQRMQNLWTKKGYDLAFKACDCKCAKGHLRKDLDYIPPPKPKKKTSKKKHPSGESTKPVGMAPQKAQPQPVSNSGHRDHRPQLRLRTDSLSSDYHPQLRLRTDSLGSAGSSPPNSADSSSPPTTPNSFLKKGSFDFFTDAAQAASGNIFKRRSDMSAFSFLAATKRNPYHIKMEDEGPHGNDETRCFILSNLSTFKQTEVKCGLCSRDLVVYDRYPLIDGTFFLSPISYNSKIELLVEGRKQFLNAICMFCLEGECSLKCTACRKPWDGSTLLLGTMYSYDIFAAMPCCHKRLTCNNCNRRVIDPAYCGYTYYSQFSQNIRCPFCRTNGHHFVKPLRDCFYINRRPIWK